MIAGLALFALLAGWAWFTNRMGEDDDWPFPEREDRPVLEWS